MYLNTNTLETISNTFHFQDVLLCRQKKSNSYCILRHLVYRHTLVFCSYDDNYAAVTKPIHRGKGQNMLFIMLGQELHNKMPMLPSEETLLMTAGIL